MRDPKLLGFYSTNACSCERCFPVRGPRHGHRQRFKYQWGAWDRIGVWSSGEAVEL